MTRSKGRTSALRWAGRLNGFVLERQAEYALPPHDDLSSLERQQMEICRDSLVRFLDFTEREQVAAPLPDLARQSFEDRLLVVLTDVPGGLAARELFQQGNVYGIWLTEQLWVHWQRDRANHDPDFRYHYRYWTYWNQRLKPDWELSAEEGAQLWLHTEGYLLQQMRGGWAQHVWSFDGSTLSLVREAIESGGY